MINFINKAKKNPNCVAIKSNKSNFLRQICKILPYYPVTAYPVITQFLFVDIVLSAGVNAVAPQFPLMSIVAEVVDVLFVKFVKISTKASFESWQFCNTTEFLKIVVHLSKLVHPFAKVVKFVTKVVLKLGMKFNETQPLNIALILVTFCVLNSGTDCKEEQLLNILVIPVTFCVLNNGTDCNEGQPENILTILVTFCVLNSGTDCKEGQLENILNIVVTFCVLNNGTDCKEEQPENILPIPVTLPIVLTSNLST